MEFVRRLGLPGWMGAPSWDIPDRLVGPHHGSADAGGLVEALGPPAGLEAALQLSGSGVSAIKHIPQDPDGISLEFALRTESFLRLWDGDERERALLAEAAPGVRTTLWLELTAWERRASAEGRPISLWARNGVPMSTPVPGPSQGARAQA